MRYWFDGTFEGMLTAVFDAYRFHEDPEIFTEVPGIQLSLDGRERRIETDLEKAGRVWRGIERRMSVHALQLFYSAWLGESDEVPGLVLHAIRAGMCSGEDVLGKFQDRRIHRLNELYRKVVHEVHFFTGTLRFRQSTAGFLHAGYEPDGNITELLVPHFAERFSSERFLIHDLKRGHCAVYDGRQVTLSMVPSGPLPPQREGEDDFERLWQHYFKAIAVEGRKNPALQRRFLPRRYWKHLTEMHAQDGTQGPDRENIHTIVS
jgi:probable DNA metabolism protein